MSCVTKEQWNEVYTNEKSRLKELQADGYDINEASTTLETMNSRMKKGNMEGAKDVIKKHQGKYTALTDIQIAEINKNKPRLIGGVNLKVINGYRTQDGVIMYNVTFPNSNKEYLMSEDSVYYDQIDVRNGMFGSEPGSTLAGNKAYTKLEYDIWNDQDNALILFDKLAEIEGEQTEHTAYLRDLLEQITDPTKDILNKFKVYLNMEAESNWGVATPSGHNPKLLLNIREGSNIKGDMSAAEVYVHEMIHMAVEVAKEFQTGAIASTMSEMRALYAKAAKKIKIEDLVEHGNTEKAKRRYGYIFNDEVHGLAEFIAYAMTNEKFKSLLNDIEIGENKTTTDTSTLWGKLSNLIIKVYEGLRGLVSKRDPSMKMDERVGLLVANIWAHNGNTVKNARLQDRILSNLDKVQKYGDDKILKLTGKVVSATGVVMDKAIDLTKGTAVGGALAVSKLVAEVVNPWAESTERNAYKKALSGLGDALESKGIPFAGLLRAESSLQMTLDYIKEDDSEVTKIEKMGLLVKKIDQHREYLIEEVGKGIMSKFGKLGHKDQTALTKALIETDVKVLMRDYTLPEIAELLESSDKVQEEIQKIEDELDSMKLIVRDGNIANYYKTQAAMLGSFMTTGKGDSSLNVNAADIVGMKYTYLEGAVHKDNNISKNALKLSEMVDKLATLHAIGHVDLDAKNRVVSLINNKSDAVENLLSYHTLHEDERVKYNVQVHSALPIVKGEIKDLKAPYFEVSVSKNDPTTIKHMKKEGWKYVGESNVNGMAVYKKWTQGQESFDKQAVAKINEQKQMHNLLRAFNVSGQAAEETTEQAREQVQKLFKDHRNKVNAMVEGIHNREADGYVPMVSKDGTINNFAVTIDNGLYEDVMEQDKKAPVLLGKMIGEISEKLHARQHNNQMLIEIETDMSKNYKRSEGSYGVNQKEYIEIGPDSEHRKGSSGEEFANRLWRDMPQNMKDYINSKEEKKRYIAIPRSMGYAYFGMRSPSVLNASIPRAVTAMFPKVKGTVEEALNANGLAYAVNATRLIADIWQEVVGLIKLDIVVKMPMVIMTNILSNMAYAFALGQLDPVTGMLQAFKDTKEYMKLEKEYIALNLKVRSGKGDIADKRRLKQIRVLQAENPVKDLMDAGLFTSVASDSAMIDLKSRTRLGAWVEKKTENVPQIIKDGWNTMYVTESTGLYQAMLEATAYSDFVARASRYQFLLAKKNADGNPALSKAVALKAVTDDFVNYNRVLGQFWTWMKELGFAQFMQYMFGATKSLVHNLKDRPISMISMSLLGSIPNPSDALGGYANVGYKLHDPFDIMLNQVPENVMTPAMLRYAGIM